jgi:hypothetical protein
MMDSILFWNDIALRSKSRQSHQRKGANRFDAKLTRAGDCSLAMYGAYADVKKNPAHLPFVARTTHSSSRRINASGSCGSGPRYPSALFPSQKDFFDGKLIAVGDASDPRS